MKKIILLIAALTLIHGTVFAEQRNISFIYLNGSNSNDEKALKWFENGVNKLHPMIKKRFEENRDTREWFNSETGIYHINENPVIFYWGDMSHTDLDFVKQQLDLSKAISSTLSYTVRKMLTAYMHDAIWVQKTHNMTPILQNLNEVVKQEDAKGNEVILYGYSAGTFVTYQYLFNNLPYLDLVELFNELDVSDDLRAFIKENRQNNTCIAALSDAKIGVVSSDGHLLLDESENFKKNYLNLNQSTEKLCAPPNTLKGIVNFASPLVLFYSDLADPNYELTYYNVIMMKYIMDNGLFWLTVNFREDPLGFPASRNLTPHELEDLSGVSLDNPSGLIYDNSGVWSKRSCLFAHTAYWNARRPFSNAIVKSLVKGMKFNYDDDYQIQVLQRDSKRDEL